MSNKINTITSTKISENKSESTVPRNRQDVLKWNGWGYKDSRFRINDNNIIEFSGDRYYL
ncbi:alkyldihydroxyacetonephosphate synthase [Vespula squamosa]|uniref:Alkylglycerone-phosphate synthase n=1 Tax=Vespula squamosa TaxID=30214 RepID=A0ABD2BYI6_VESSQ